VVGLFVPVIGVAAGIGLVLYFTGAVATVIRARWYAHIPFPLLYAAPVVAALVLTATD
jgi:multisubunit Na+/H+ antiporter MnhC subunit